MRLFWQTLPKPFFVMAPMKDVTDAAFRRLLTRYGKPDVMWTEFVSADGLYYGHRKSADTERVLLRDLQFSTAEQPIVAQIFSSRSNTIEYATKLIAGLGFDGVDINMGCPDKNIEKQEAGAALIKNPAHAARLIRAAREASDLPVSVKTRIGYNKESLDEWLTALLETKPAAITLHLRTRKELSLVPADWELMKEAVSLRDRVNPDVLLIGNGDVRDLADARAKIAESGCDGAMLGRALLGNPWLFEGLRGFRKSPYRGFTKPPHGLDEKLAALVDLARDFENLSPPKRFDILKKHIKAFVTGFDGAAALRAKLMEADSAAELERIIRDYPL